MTTGYVIPVDPAELSTRFSVNDDALELVENDGIFDDEPEIECPWSGTDYEGSIEPLLDRLPKREADLIELYFIRKKRQADIASIFGVTQAAVSYRLDRGLQRIKFLLSIPQVTEDEMRETLGLIPTFTEIDVDILVGMWETTCQSEVATRLGLTQGRVRHRFFKAVKTLKESAAADDTYEPFCKIFSAIADDKRFNVLREVKLPQWQNRGGDECV